MHAFERVVCMRSYMRACLCVCVAVYLLKVNQLFLVESALISDH